MLCLPAVHALPAAQVEFKSVFDGMAAAQQADIFVGVHGANMVNGWFMRPGSSIIELTAFGFDEAQQHVQYAERNARVGG
jgi:capsular polysaccharide biosynthesis protein